MTLRDGETCSANVSEVCLAGLFIRVLHVWFIFTSCLTYYQWWKDGQDSVRIKVMGILAAFKHLIN